MASEDVLSAANTDVADFIRISTSASEVREESMIEPRYLNFFVKLSKPKVEQSASRMSKRDVSTLAQSTCDGGKHIASVLDSIVSTPRCIIKLKRRRWLKSYDAPKSKSAQLLKKIAQSSANSDVQRSNGDASRFRNERSPMVTPFERVRKTGLATGHVKVQPAE